MGNDFLKSLVRYFDVLGVSGYYNYTSTDRLMCGVLLDEFINEDFVDCIESKDIPYIDSVMYSLLGSDCILPKKVDC